MDSVRLRVAAVITRDDRVLMARERGLDKQGTPPLERSLPVMRVTPKSRIGAPAVTNDGTIRVGTQHSTDSYAN
jgi:hypothetical protein